MMLSGQWTFYSAFYEIIHNVEYSIIFFSMIQIMHVKKTKDSAYIIIVYKHDLMKSKL